MRYRCGPAIGVGALNAVNEALKNTVGLDLTEVMRAQTFEGRTTCNIRLDASKDTDKEE